MYCCLIVFLSKIQCEKKSFAKNLALLHRNARKESVRLRPFRDSTTQYNSPQYTAALRIPRRTARSAADAVERTAEQYWVDCIA